MMLYFSLWILSVRIKDFVSYFVEEKKDMRINIRVFVVFVADDKIFRKSKVDMGS